MVPRRCGTNVLGLWDCGGALLGSVEEQRSLHFQSTVGSEATDFILLVDNATSVLQILHAGAYFAALEMLSVHASAGACVVEGGWRRFARALVIADGCFRVSMY